MDENGRVDWLREDMQEFRAAVRADLVKIQETLEKIEERLRKLENWRAYVFGVSVASSILVTVVVNVLVQVVMRRVA